MQSYKVCYQDKNQNVLVVKTNSESLSKAVETAHKALFNLVSVPANWDLIGAQVEWL